MSRILDLDGLADFISENKGKRAALTFHSMGDTDSIASAVALSYLFESSTIVSPDKLTYNAESALVRCGFSKGEMNAEIPQGTELVVLLDVNNLEDCGRLGGAITALGVPILIIDHHAPSHVSAANAFIFDDEGYNSTSSIVYELMSELEGDMDANLAKLLAIGIISDSAEFKNSTALTFSQLGELFDIAGTDYASMAHEFMHVADANIRAQTMRALFGASVEVREGLVIASGSTPNRASAAADDAIKVGADLSIFTSRSTDEAAISARLRPTLDKMYGIHLGVIMKKVGAIIGGTGGGHPCAAGAYGPRSGSVEEAVSLIISNVEELVRQHKQR
ncbi:MAG: DHH family phosphoesterase [Candidatus Marsarchaeota archaeon]|nr:DHH family phosphoesterase [Candidatus Marsarchaeota archaeon]